MLSVIYAYAARLYKYRPGLPAGAAELTTRLTRLGFVDREGTSVELFALEPLDSSLSRRTVGHLDKAKAFGAASVPVRNDPDFVHHTIGLEELAEGMISGTKCKVTYKDIGAFGDSYASRRRRRYRSNARSNVPLYLAQRSANISLLLASYHQAPERLRRT